MLHPRAKKEKRIVEIMINQYCHDIHQSIKLCEECQELLDYAEKKLLKCPFIKNKPICSKCDIHCYNTHQQEKIKEVMRTVAPKMIYTHPRDTLWYLFYKLIHKNQKVKVTHED